MNLFLYSLKLDPTYRVVFFLLMESHSGCGRVDEASRSSISSKKTPQRTRAL